MTNLEPIYSVFALQSRITQVKPLNIGHINDSFILRSDTAQEPWYLLQRINHHIFKDIAALQHNIVRVTDHLRQRLISRSNIDPDRSVMRLIPTHEGAWFHQDDQGQYWRMYLYVKQCVSFTTIDPKLALEAGRAFAAFQDDLSDMPCELLCEVIPHFHSITFRLEQFHEALAMASDHRRLRSRVESCQALIEQVNLRAQEMVQVELLCQEGLIPKRINHCDTKINNLLFNQQHEAICVVDLDTVMPGFVLSDFGDFMRTGANSAAEDEACTERIRLRLDIFEAYTQSYLQAARFLTEMEIQQLAFGAKLLTYMQFVRFLGDYLNGDTYYKTQHEHHNLQRARAQLALLEDMERHFSQMNDLVGRYALSS